MVCFTYNFQHFVMCFLSIVLYFRAINSTQHEKRDGSAHRENQGTNCVVPTCVMLLIVSSLVTHLDYVNDWVLYSAISIHIYNKPMISVLEFYVCVVIQWQIYNFSELGPKLIIICCDLKTCSIFYENWQVFIEKKATKISRRGVRKGPSLNQLYGQMLKYQTTTHYHVW